MAGNVKALLWQQTGQLHDHGHTLVAIDPTHINERSVLLYSLFQWPLLFVEIVGHHKVVLATRSLFQPQLIVQLGATFKDAIVGPGLRVANAALDVQRKGHQLG